MKAFNAVYKHGHFIDVESGLRLIPVQGAKYVISAEDKAFKAEDAKLIVGEARSSKKMAEWAKSEYGEGNYVKLLDINTKLCFRVGNSRTIQGDENHQYIFVCSINEDLYLYLIKGRKGDDAADWRLAKCKCTLESCLLGGLTLTEKVPAESLNALFNNTVQFYFSMQRSAATNAFDTFFLYEKGMEVTFEGATWQRYKNLGKMRNQLVAKGK